MADAARVVLVGGGNMGAALLAGWCGKGRDPAAIDVIEPDPARAAAMRGRFGVRVMADSSELSAPTAADAVVFAVKPQRIVEVVPAYAGSGRPACLFVSIAAGTPVARLSALLGETAAIVRAMPNTPAQIGRGITVAFANGRTAPVQRALADDLLGAVGDVAWVDDEALLDPVTAVSGSGPAYVFLLAECLAEAAVAAGLPAELSERLARATVAGAAELMRVSGEGAADLRAKVTSPGGTTAAALAVLDGPEGLRPLLTEAVGRATERARELGGLFPPATPRN